MFDSFLKNLESLDIIQTSLITTIISSISVFIYFYTKENFNKGENTSHILGPAPNTYVNSSPEVVEHILKNKFNNYVKGELTKERVHDLLGNGIFASDGESAKLQRKTAANIFNVKSFKDWVANIFQNEMDVFFGKLNEYSKTGKEFDLYDEFCKFTLDSFCEIGFGIKLNCLESFEPVAFAAAFDKSQVYLAKRSFNPFWKLSEKFTKEGREGKICFKEVHDFALNFVLDLKNEENRDKRKDLLSLFLNLKNSDGNVLHSDEELAYIVLNFIIAGRDTTAQALSWCIYELSKNPSVELKLLEEIQTNIGNSVVTYEKIKEMKYANACFLEALRLHPSVPGNKRAAIKDDILPDGTFVKAGSYVLWSPYTQGRMPSIWGEDCENFNPDRWINEKVKNQFEFSAFHAGPRICLGKNMAEMEGVFVLVNVLKYFKFKLSNVNEVKVVQSLTSPVSGLKVTAALRT
ncbi:Protein kinase alk2 [Lobulomyces angularis]|nr:Protein kinase alk2 [Lobulomyces angularis]